MVSVNTNIAALGAQNNLKMNNFGYEKSMQRLSSGQRINSAADDAAGLSVASSMTAQVKGLKMASKNASDGISLVNTVEGALNEATNILQRMRELSVQSVSDTNSGADRTYIEDEITQLKNELNRISSTTQYNGMNVLDGTFTDRTMQIGNLSNQTLKFGVSSVDTTTLGAYQRTGVAKVAAATADHAKAVDGLNQLYSAGNYVVAGSFGSKTLTMAGGADARDVATAFNKVAGETGIKGVAITRGQLIASANATTYSFTLQGKSTTSSAVTATVTSTADQTALRDAINAVSGATGITASLTSDKSKVNLTQADGYDIIVGAVSGADMTLHTFNHDGDTSTANITLDHDAKDSGGVGGTVRLSGDKAFTITPQKAANLFSGATTLIASELKALGDISVKTVTKATNAISILDTSLAMIAASRSKLGAIQNRLSSTVENLSTIISKTEASLANIMDADFSNETTELSKSQILNQAATAMLAQANQANQGVLRLLQAG